MKKILTSLVVVVLFGFIEASGQTDCKITREVDKFTDKITIYTPVVSGIKASPVVLMKEIKNNDTTYYALFHLYGNSAYGKGCYVIFEDGEKWAKEDVSVNTKYIVSGRYLYQATVTLGWEDVQRLIAYRVTDIRLHDSQIEIKDKNSDNFICAAKKVIDAE